MMRVRKKKMSGKRESKKEAQKKPNVRHNVTLTFGGPKGKRREIEKKSIWKTSEWVCGEKRRNKKERQGGKPGFEE